MAQYMTYVYVRFPYHLGPQVESLANQISEVIIGTHHFSAQVTYEGRAQIYKNNAFVDQWDIEIAGNKIPALSKDTMTDLHAKACAPFAEKFEKSVVVNV